MSADYWPWWLGGTALALVAISHPLLTGRPLGVSGALERLLRPRGRGECPTPASTAPASGSPPELKLVPEDSEPADAAGANPPSAAPPRGRRTSDLLFLGGMIAGGALARWIEAGRIGGASLSPEFVHRFGTGPTAIAVLFVGGALVGFGTRWSGGCTSGHGLSGVGRLHPSSLLATATFFGVAIGVSFLIDLVIH